MTSSARTTVVIPARDAAATLPHTLRALDAQDTEQAFDVIVVDDDSTDATAAIAESGRATVLRRRPAQGPAAARNAGAGAASGDVLAFTDADCRPAPDWLRAAVAALADADLVLGPVVPVPGEWVGPFHRSLFVSAPSPLFESANLVVRRELFERLGGFQGGVGPHTGEDTRFGWAAIRSGARIRFAREAVVRHEVFARGPRAFVTQRRTLGLFPRLARDVPELRRHFFYAGVFLNRRTAAFDLALAGVAAAVLLRRPPALTAALPYATLAARHARRWGLRRAPEVLAVSLAADAVGALTLLCASARTRAPVL